MRKSDYPKVLRRGIAVMVIVLLLFGAFAPAAMAADWPDCTFGCNAKDFNVVDVYLGDASGDPLPPCNGDDVDAHIWIEVDAKHHSRYAIILLANITIDGVLKESFWDETPAGRCVANAIPGGISCVNIYSFTWHNRESQ